MTIKRNKRGLSFDSHGTEGMLDVVLGCTLIFLLMSSLISVGESESQEKILPTVNLSQSGQRQGIGALVGKNTITLRHAENAPLIFFDDEPVSIEQLEARLRSLAGVGHIALRRDRDLPCGWEDRIIMLCQDAGIEKIAIVVSQTNNRK